MKLFKKSVAPAGYKNKQTVSRRRYLARVLSSLMYRYALRQSASVPRFLYPAKGYGIISLTLNLHVFDLPVDGVYAMFFQEIIRLAERSAAKESTVRR